MKPTAQTPTLSQILSLIVGVLAVILLLGMGVTKEVPVGSVSGRVVMSENGEALEDVEVTLTPFGEAEEAGGRVRAGYTNEQGHYRLANLPAGLYRIEASAKEHSLPPTSVMVSEGKPTVLDLEITPNPAYLELYASQRVFTPDEKPQVELHGFVHAEDVRVELHRLDVSAIASHGGLEETLSPLAHPGYSEKKISLSDVSKQSTTLIHHITEKDAEGAFVEQLGLPGMPEGFYWVQCSADGEKKGTFINVTRIALVTKSAPKHTLCYVTDLQSGKPIAGAEIRLQTANGLTHLGTSDAKGLADVPAPKQVKGQAVLVASYGQSEALTGFISNGTPDEATGSADDDVEAANVRVFTYSDRPVYRPGDEVLFKSIVRKLVGDEYRLPGTGDAKVEIRDPDDNLLDTMSLPISAHGTLHGGFKTSSEAKPGVYKIVVKAFGSNDQYFVNLAAYRKPEFTVKVKPLGSHYVMGQKAKAEVDCSYYFGGPVVGAKVSATIYRNPHWDYAFDEDEENAPSDAPEFVGGEYSNNVEAVTDANGKAVIEFDTKADNDPDRLPMDYDYTVDAYVKEAGEKQFNGTGKVFVTRGDFNLSARSGDDIAAVGDVVPITISAVSYDKPAKPVVGRKLTVEVGTDSWSGREVRFTSGKSFQLQTGADGKAVLNLPITSKQSLTIKATTQDDGARTIEASAYLYVAGSSAMRGQREKSLKIVLDKKAYKAGETAHAMIQADEVGGVALVCVEGEDLLAHYVLPLDSASTELAIPITKEDSPNAYLTVAYVHGKKFSRASSTIKVQREDRALSVSVLPEKTQYLPGGSALVTVKTADAAGHPLSANVSLGVVDESIYAIQKDSTDILRGLYPRRRNMVITSYSFPEIYLDGGDKGGGSVPVRTRFLDTALWAPEVQTGADGLAQVRVPLPDNLTSWRATVVGATDDTSVGMATANFIVRKPLMVRLETPMFLVAEDRVQATLNITNDTGADADVHVRLDTEGVGLQGERFQVVRVRSNSMESVRYTLAAASSGNARVVARAWIDGGASDGVEQKLTVSPHGRLATDAFSGDIDRGAKFGFELAPGFDKNAGRLRIVVTPSIASGMLASLDGLIDYPYGCVEQTMSRFLPAVLVSKSLDQLGVPRPDLKAKIGRIAVDGFARLNKMQHEDGGWGWWTYDQSDLYMTAYVLDGLDRARVGGYESLATRTNKALQWAENRLAHPEKSDRLRGQLYLAYTLARYGHKDSAGLALKRLDLRKAGAQECAFAAMAAAELGPEFKNMRDGFLDRLLSLAGGEGNAIRWQEDGAWGDEPTGTALVALATLRPEADLVPKIIRGLMANRDGASWTSTQATAQVLIGLTRYLAYKKETIQPASFTVLVNGKPVWSGSVSADTIGQNLETSVPIGQLAKGQNLVEIKSNSRTAFYSADLRRYQVQTVLGQLIQDGGLTVQRRYYVMTPQRTDDGVLRLLPSKNSVTQVSSGDVIRCELTINSDRDREFLMIEDPIPCNCRITEREDPDDGEAWSWWWCQTVIRDDRIAFFARNLKKGRQKITYSMRAEQFGTAHALPTLVQNMYDPAEQASSGENPLEVTP